MTIEEAARGRIRLRTRIRVARRVVTLICAATHDARVFTHDRATAVVEAAGADVLDARRVAQSEDAEPVVAGIQNGSIAGSDLPPVTTGAVNREYARLTCRQTGSAEGLTNGGVRNGV